MAQCQQFLSLSLSLISTSCREQLKHLTAKRVSREFRLAFPTTPPYSSYSQKTSTLRTFSKNLCQCFGTLAEGALLGGYLKLLFLSIKLLYIFYFTEGHLNQVFFPLGFRLPDLICCLLNVCVLCLV